MGSEMCIRDSLRSTMAAMHPAPSSHHRPRPGPPSVPGQLLDVSHIYVRVDAVLRPLTRPYKGPFKVLQRNEKTFTICRAGRSWVVSVDRLKPAWGFDGPYRVAAPLVSPVESGAPPVSVAVPLAPAEPVSTRFGRVSWPPTRY